MSKRTKYEIIRRSPRLGDLKRVLRHRCGHELPDDDAGREYLTELLYLSLDKNLGNVIEIWAPWLDPLEDNLRSVATSAACPMLFGSRRQKLWASVFRLTNKEREKVSIRQIAPCDITKEQVMEQRKARHRAQERERRQRQGAVLCDQFRQNAEALRAEADALGITYETLRQRKRRQAKRVASRGPEAETGCRKSVRDKL